MKINNDKTKVILFNMSQKYRFPPEVTLSDGEILEVTDTTKILGVIVSNTLKWSKNTDHITSKAFNKIWILRQLQKLGFGKDFILDVYMKEIRSILEYCVPVWSGAITQKESQKIENIQKIVLRVLLKHQYSSYTDACRQFHLEKLHNRRRKLCVKFSNKEYKKPDHGIFKKIHSKSKRRLNKKVVTEPKARTERYYKSAIPYLSRLLNSHINQT